MLGDHLVLAADADGIDKAFDHNGMVGIAHVTLTRTTKHARLQIRLRGGQIKTLEVPHPLSGSQLRKTPEQIVKEIDTLLDSYTDGEIAQELNRRGIKSSMGARFNASIVAKLRRGNGLTSHHDRLRKTGLLTKSEIAQELNVHHQTITAWHKHGLLVGYKSNDRGERLYEMPDEQNRPTKNQGQKLTERSTKVKVTSHAANEVHHDA